ncbi:hypothetical protein [Aurantiacibacter sp. D1-12]|uniref:hypothetical protein n=1 Tax=Aurantiacibacter sp. D1-12 TaxID=2993658 RepID=UPI00237C5B92|nr:hypothetical protein [Aurantiacibacter sp. D1-12]MDE1466154.1 hypothetical protein [Aurantiacibacter sp. D1-12]
MDWELVTIFTFVLTMVVILLSFGTFAGARSRAHKIKQLEIEARIEEAKAAQAHRSLSDQSDLEDRLRVIERIVTDPTADLSRQIEDLRELKADAEKVR